MNWSFEIFVKKKIVAWSFQTGGIKPKIGICNQTLCLLYLSVIGPGSNMNLGSSSIYDWIVIEEPNKIYKRDCRDLAFICLLWSQA